MKKDNSGAFFRNERREKDTHPHYTGKAMIKGVEFYVNVWNNKDKNGTPYCSMNFKEIVNHSNQARQAINTRPVMNNQSNNYTHQQTQQSYNNKDEGFDESEIPF